MAPTMDYAVALLCIINNYLEKDYLIEYSRLPEVPKHVN